MPRVSWTDKAKLAADWIANQLADARRGALEWREPGVIALFETFDDPRGRVDLAKLNSFLVSYNAPVLGMGAADDGVTWCLLVRPGTVDVVRLHLAVWCSWPPSDPKNVPGADPRLVEEALILMMMHSRDDIRAALQRPHPALLN